MDANIGAANQGKARMQQTLKGMSLAVAILLTACGGGGGSDGSGAVTAATADVSVTATVPAAVAVGQAFTASIAVSNPGATIAQNMVATATLPPGISFASVRMPGALCVAGTKVSCRIPSLPSGVTVMEIDVTATAVGNLAISAEATSTTFDPNTANNAETKNTLVGASTASIQQAIDSAAPGQTVIVDPGNYVGTLTFGGKNITLASRDGPASTQIIQPTGLSAVQMGTGGTLTGFTIVARSAGVEVDGAGGSVISNNVFDPSLWGNPGALGVYGVNAFSGATVSSNTFRNHSCNPPPLAGSAFGVVTFSSLGNTPYGGITLADNVFENNNCPDVAVGALPPSTSIAITANNSALLQPQLALVTAGSNLTLSNTNPAGGSISWSNFSVGTGGNINLASPVQNLGGGSIVLTSASPSSGGISGVLTVQ